MTGQPSQKIAAPAMANARPARRSAGWPIHGTPAAGGPAVRSSAGRCPEKQDRQQTRGTRCAQRNRGDEEKHQNQSDESGRMPEVAIFPPAAPRVMPYESETSRDHQEDKRAPVIMVDERREKYGVGRFHQSEIETIGPASFWSVPKIERGGRWRPTRAIATQGATLMDDEREVEAREIDAIEQPKRAQGKSGPGAGWQPRNLRAPHQHRAGAGGELRKLGLKALATTKTLNKASGQSQRSGCSMIRSARAGGRSGIQSRRG